MRTSEELFNAKPVPEAPPLVKLYVFVTESKKFVPRVAPGNDIVIPSPKVLPNCCTFNLDNGFVVPIPTFPLFPAILIAENDVDVDVPCDTNKSKFVSPLFPPPLAIIPAPCLASLSGKTRNKMPDDALMDGVTDYTVEPYDSGWFPQEGQGDGIH